MDWKKIGKKMLFPPVWVMTVLSIVSAVLLTLVFVNGWDQMIISYVVYVLAFYTLSVVTVFCALVLPKRYKKSNRRYMTIPWATAI